MLVSNRDNGVIATLGLVMYVMSSLQGKARGCSVGKQRSRSQAKRRADAKAGMAGSFQDDYLEYVADLLLQLEEMAEREGNRELAERLRHSRQVAERD